ncbi:MAG: methyltransferase regulatory domain-containing protein [Planctomycetaceae bacterium]
MTSPTQNPYDAIPYQSGSFPQTHPQHLAMLATLFGMSPAHVEKCRVLELGCAEGGNIIPMAVSLPNSRFLGIDYSAKQIDIGQQTIRELGLQNIRLAQQNILDVNSSLGTFDFIIAQGIFSWVPEDVRIKVLEICQKHLAPQGVAYISYNAKPGGFIRTMVREMLNFHLEKYDGFEERISAGRKLLDFLTESAAEQNPAYHAILEWERQHVRQSLDHQLAHDLLEENHQPFFISEFMEQASKYDLQYLGDANFSTMLPRNFSQPVFDQLKQYAKSMLEMEQYMDFVRNRSFRQTLLAHAAVPLNHQLDPAIVSRFYISGSLSPKEESSEPYSNRMEVFQTPSGQEIQSNVPLVKAAFAILREQWPGNISFSNLLTHARSRLLQSETADNSPDRDFAELTNSLMTCFTVSAIELSVRSLACGPVPKTRISTSRLTRYQAAKGEIVTNDRHETVRLDAWQRELLLAMDGSCTRDELIVKFSKRMPNGQTLIGHGPEAMPVPHFSTETLRHKIDAGLQQLASLGLVRRVPS